MPSPDSTCRSAGFTLLELMIVVAIIGILASIATPMYGDYVRRSKILDATTAMGDVRSEMEKFFMDNRTYLSGAVCAVSVAPSKMTQYNGNPGSHFSMTCTPGPGDPQVAYILQVDGKPGDMGGFSYTVNQRNDKATLGVPPGWSGTGLNCWVLKKDGSC